MGHPRTNTDISFTSSFNENDIRKLAQMELSYMKDDAENKIYNSRVEIDKIRRELNFQVNYSLLCQFVAMILNRSWGINSATLCI